MTRWEDYCKAMTYREFYTNAPFAYDYGYTVSGDFKDVEGFREQVRLVRIPSENAEYQTNRYASGMYYVKEVS